MVLHLFPLFLPELRLTIPRQTKRSVSSCKTKDKPRKAMLQYFSAPEDNRRNQTKAELKEQPQGVQLPTRLSTSLLCTHQTQSQGVSLKKGCQIWKPRFEPIQSRHWVPVLIRSAFCWRVSLDKEGSLFC